MALVGAGRIARLHAENLVAGVRGLRLVAVADPLPGAAAELAAQAGCEALENWRDLLGRPEIGRASCRERV